MGVWCVGMQAAAGAPTVGWRLDPSRRAAAVPHQLASPLISPRLAAPRCSETQGRAYQIRKPMVHITVKVAENDA